MSDQAIADREHMEDAPLVLGRPSYAEITDQISIVPMVRPKLGWYGLFGIFIAISVMMTLSITWLLTWGVGVWGVNIPVAWGFAIVNFVWWIGIGHAGTLISAILILVRKKFRTSINRFAEAMTLIAVMNAGLFPLLHLGRPWKFYYLFPYPSTINMWPQWRSALVWDVFAVLTYFTVSLIFWYVGLIPDLATMRDSARGRMGRTVYGVLSLGWRGAARHWQNHQIAYLLLAGLATPLVVSVHSIVSLDFSISLLPGWHSTIFPPYFVAGAIYSGFAMVFTLAIPMRSYYKLHNLITERHLDAMAKIMLVSGLIVAYGYLMEFFMGWYSQDHFEQYLMINRSLGRYTYEFWGMIFGNVIVLQSLWFKWVRTHAIPLFIASLLINAGMWLERFVIVIVSLHRDFMPSAWGMYSPTVWDITLLVGTLGFFGFMFMLFIRTLPSISMSEIRELIWDEHFRKTPPSEVEYSLYKQEELPKRSASEASQIPDAVSRPPRSTELYGLVAEFAQPEPLLHAVQAVRRRGYRLLDTFTPFPVEHMPDALGLPKTRVPLLCLIGGLLGAVSIYLLMSYSAIYAFPWNVGGRPLNSWPSFIPITFEIGVLIAASFSFIGMLALNRLPCPYHSVFNTPGFARASRDRFYLCVQSDDPQFDRERTAQLLHTLDAMEVHEVAP